MRYLFIVAAILIGAIPALGTTVTNPVVLDPDQVLKGGVVIESSTALSDNGWAVTGLKSGPDLDLGFNDLMDVRLRVDKDSTGAVRVRYGTSRTPGLDKSREFEIPADTLKRDGQWHVYRVDLGLEKLWRGNLADLAVLPPSADKAKTGCEFGGVTVGDFGAEVYIPNYEGFPKTEYDLSSKHFRFIWNEARANANPPMTPEWAHGCLRNIEECWQLYTKAFGMNEPCRSDGKGHKFLLNFTCNQQGYFAGGDMLNIDPSGLRVDPPTWVIPHEFRHCCQSFSRSDGGPTPQNMYEADANYTRECWLWFYGPTYDPTGGDSSVEYTRLLNYCIPHPRTYYIDWPFAVYLYQNPDNLPDIGGQFWWKVWAQIQPGEGFWDTIQRLSPNVSRKDLLGYIARRRSFAYEHHLPADISERTELKRSPDSSDWWIVPSEMAPMQCGYAIHELIPDKKGGAVTVELRGISNKDRGSDWRASLIAISDDGTERYGKLWSTGSQSITLGPKENKLLLTVAGTPEKIIPVEFDDVAAPYRSAPAKARMPYEIRVTGAKPKESAPDLKAAFHAHKNGGGKVADSAKVDATAYVGPNAVVMGTAQVLGNARIEDFAVVSANAQVMDNAVVSGHATIGMGAVIKDHAKVRDYAEVRRSTVSGNARVLEHALMRDNAAIKDWATAKGRAECWGDQGSAISGDAEADGDYCGGQPMANGFQYGHQPFFGNPWIDGRRAPERILAEYDFDQANAPFAYDGYGSSDGILRGDPKWVEKDGDRPGVLKLTGKEYVLLDRHLVDAPEFTIAAWVKWDGGAANQPLWFFGADSKQCMFLTPNDGKGHVKFVARLGGKEDSFIGSKPLPKGEWAHVAVTGQGIYVNGALDSKGAVTIKPEQVLPANVNSIAQHAYLGRSADPKQPLFRGEIDRISFYSKALTDAEIAASMKADPASISNKPPAPTPRAGRRRRTP